MNDDKSPQERFSVLPWSAIVQFCTFQQSLSLRLVCWSWRLSMEEALSFAVCSDFLFSYLKQENMFVLMKDLETWKDPFGKKEQVARVLEATSTTTALQKLLQLMRVLQEFPQQVAVAFSPQYGRHCIPVEWDPKARKSILKYATPCQRENCPTCQLTIPNVSSATNTESAIGNHLELRNDKGPLDLTNYVPKCIPNLPPDVHCPSCQTTNQRTLLLAELSYRTSHSEVTAPNLTPLTWDPSRTNNDQVDSKDLDPPSPKRHKTEEKLAERPKTRSFPPKYNDMAIPTFTGPLLAKPHSKHAISMHCSKCHNFAIIAPAALCWNEECCCHERGRHLEDGTILGGVFSRTKCCVDDCLLPIPCHHCSHSNFHDSYAGEDGTSQRLLRRAAACDACCKTYCPEHSWIATACHHW